ncbi:MAG: amino acid ABC transporter permease [Ilumatobacteraceae bacterium]
MQQHVLDFDELVALERRTGSARHPTPLRTVISVAMLIAIGLFAASIIRNKHFEWDVFADYFLDRRILEGLRTTIFLTLVATTAAFVLGALLVLLRLSRVPVAAAISWGVTWFFRSVPLLVQLVFWFNIGFLYPKISFGLPFLDPFATLEGSELIGPMRAALLGLSLNGAAYASEIIRGGVIAIDSGQREAADALAMPPFLVFRKVLLPQAMRAIIPPAGNLTIELAKAATLVSVIAVADLLYSAQLIYSVNFKVVPLLMVATVWYLILTSVLSVGQFYLERYYAAVRCDRSRPPRRSAP